RRRPRCSRTRFSTPTSSRTRSSSRSPNSSTNSQRLPDLPIGLSLGLLFLGRKGSCVINEYVTRVKNNRDLLVQAGPRGAGRGEHASRLQLPRRSERGRGSDRGRRLSAAWGG